MKRVILTTASPVLSQKSRALSFGLALVFGASAFAQSAADFDINKNSAKAASQKAPASTKAGIPNAAPGLEIGPSRYVAEDGIAVYVDSLASMFSMKGRETDPFGQLQDPNAKPIVKKAIATSTRRAAPTQVTPFAEIVRLIQVTTIMPGERSFLIGTRPFKQGDRFPISFRGRNLNVEVSSVSGREIEFRSLDDGETAALKLNLLPVGMTPGNGKITAPGMIREQANAPLEIEPGDPSEATSQN